MTADEYLISILRKYSARELTPFNSQLLDLTVRLMKWAGPCYLSIEQSGSRAKGTAISLASDIDYLVSLSSTCQENNGGLKSIFDSLCTTFASPFNTRKQNVSLRISIGALQVDITPARKQPGNTNDHWIYLSKTNSRQQTNIQRHITDISQSGRTDEIRVLKIWRELNKVDFPSVYLEYLLVKNVLLNKPKGAGYLASNVWYIFGELAKDTNNPLFSRVIDPANSNNILSDLLSTSEKNAIIVKAKATLGAQNWSNVIW